MKGKPLGIAVMQHSQSRAAHVRESLGVRPVDLNLSFAGDAIAQIQIDQALVGNACLVGHTLEVGQYILGQAHGDRLFQLGCVGIFAGFQL